VELTKNYEKKLNKNSHKPYIEYKKIMKKELNSSQYINSKVYNKKLLY
jgi:hypothetical protein